MKCKVETKIKIHLKVKLKDLMNNCAQETSASRNLGCFQGIRLG